jgi:hypothetical protein
LKDDVEGGELERPGEAVARDPQRRQAGQWGAYYHFFQVFAATFKAGKTITTQEQMTAWVRRASGRSLWLWADLSAREYPPAQCVGQPVWAVYAIVVPWWRPKPQRSRPSTRVRTRPTGAKAVAVAGRLSGHRSPARDVPASDY